MTPTIVVHSTPAEFLTAVAEAGGDLPLTNTSLGPIFELWAGVATPAGASAKAEEAADAKLQLFVTVWDHGELKLVFSRLGWRKCDLTSPLPPSTYPSLAPLLSLLASHLLALPPFSTNPSLLRSVVGPTELVFSLLKAWPIPTAEPKEDDRLAQQTLRLLSLSTLPPPAPLPAGHSVSRATEKNLTPNDTTSLCKLLDGFFSWDADVPPVDRLPKLLDTLRNGTLFIYRIGNGEIAAFVNVGRPTARTIAIRGVYTRRESRGQGIAERAVREVSRCYLAATSTEYNFAKEPPAWDEETRWGGRRAVCLFVAEENPKAFGAYLRAGFTAGKEKWVDRSLVGVEPGSW
ncbi:hypothetical protein BCR35DRAFT_204274 [Leucosporidium creatinivorum]|uniref:N-acetyltransferase domain-containing protein n=1 Tax=Leucosporidium creatinivorum TaxID=106004 RepID=A0A1Y2FXD3_9BASI|nr:hypothetical protein BCR35DRAFT_204274 [Leucosporidium creatinivorum]